MRKLVLLFIAFSVFGNIFSQQINRKDAEIAAKSYYYQRINNVKHFEWDDVKMTCIIDPLQTEVYDFYVFNLIDEQGYIIVSSEKKIKPVLAYSFKGSFNFGNMHPGQKEFLDYYSYCIGVAQEETYDGGEKNIAEWDDLLSYLPENGIKHISTSPILLDGINWNQDWPYNSHCPEDPDGFNGHVPVGCVATAMLHVMKYHNWPERGEGSIYHSNMNNGGYGNVSVNFGAQTYDWSAIPSTASSEVNENLGLINYHTSVSVRMMWGPQGSGAYTYDAVAALKTNFRYSNDIQHIAKDDLQNDSQWKNYITEQIDNRYPIIYAGSYTSTGHAWNCDAYQGDEFHMNWGWGGAGNAYYHLDNLISSATVGGDENNFIHNQRIVINIYPNEEYLDNCNGTKLITGTEGSFEDGSSINDYDNNQTCKYVISPECGKVVRLNFNSFDLGTGDELVIFDGNETVGKVIAVLDADNIPEDEYFVANSGVLTILFTSDAVSSGQGWNVSYTVKNCMSGIEYSATSASFGDGSGICEYNGSVLCSWIIKPQDATWISIKFNEFDLADDSDFVKIYKTKITSANEIMRFDYDNPPSNEPILVEDSVAIINFHATASNNANGWDLSYTSSVSNIDSEESNLDINISPNPGNINSTLSFETTKKSNVLISVASILGEQIANKTIELPRGNHEIRLNELVKTNLKAGIYLVGVKIDNKMTTQKFVVTE